MFLLYFRKQNSITVDYKNCFLSGPSSLSTFFNQNALSPSSITSFNSNNCYWLSTEQLFDGLVAMGNLEELCIKGTQVSLPHLSRVFEHCPKLTKLDFTCREKKWEEIQEAVLKQKCGSIDSIIQGFQKLICLKVSTSTLDARDFLNDPWLMIIRMLT